MPVAKSNTLHHKNTPSVGREAKDLALSTLARMPAHHTRATVPQDETFVVNYPRNKSILLILATELFSIQQIAGTKCSVLVASHKRSF